MRPRLLLLSLLLPVCGQAASPFPVSLLEVTDHHAIVQVEVPPQHAVYAEFLTVSAAGEQLAVDAPPVDPAPESIGPKAVYTQDITLWVALPSSGPVEAIDVRVRGCDYVEGVCYTDQHDRLALTVGR